MKVFASYRGPTGDTLELSAGETEAGTQRVCIEAFLPMRFMSDRLRVAASVYLSRSEAIDMAEALKRAALALPPE